MKGALDENDGIVPNILPLPNPVGNWGTLGMPPPPSVFPAAIDALNGFAAPPPVICGLRPTPNLEAADGVTFPVGLKEFVSVAEPVCPFAACIAPDPPKLPPNPVGCCLFKAPNSEVPNDDEPDPPVADPIVLAPAVL